MLVCVLAYSNGEQFDKIKSLYETKIFIDK